MNTTALEVPEYMFLATHSPSFLDRMTSDGSKAGPFSEDKFVQEFADSKKAFVFSLVQGTTGVGKSHLIRWLYIKLLNLKLPHTRIHLIPRSGSNLRDIIKMIVADLPGVFFDDIRKSLDSNPQQYSSKGLRGALLDLVSQHVDPKNFKGGDDPYAGIGNRDKDERDYLIEQLPVLFKDEFARKAFTGTGKVVDELVTHALGSHSKNVVREEPRVFTESDFSLKPEPLVDANRQAQNFASLLRTNEALRRHAADYVNLRLGKAITSLLNLQGVNVSDIFKEVRRILRKQGQSLILLIEDIAAVEYIDQQLLESLILQPLGPNKDLCPLKSAVGITEGWLVKMDATHRERVTLPLNLDVEISNVDGHTEKFAAGYLNVGRLEPKDIERWASRGKGDLPNACEDCQYRVECHRSFGQVGGVGLFPFNANALKELRDATQGTHPGSFNARSFINGVLYETFEHYPDDFDKGAFPPKRYREKYGKFRGAAGEQERLGKVYGDQAYQVASLHDLWGGSLDEHIYTTFKINAPAGGHGKSAVETGAPKPDTEPSPKPDQPTKTDTKRRVPSDRLTKSLKALDEWHHGDELYQAERQSVARVVRDAINSYIDFNAYGLSPSEWKNEFEAGCVNFQGQTSKPRGMPLDIEVRRKYGKNQWILSPLAIQGLMLRKHHGSWRFTYAGSEGTEFLRHVLPFIQTVADEVLQKIFLYEQDKPFDPVPAAIELLGFAALFHGHITSDPSAGEFSAAIFKSPPIVDQPQRHKAWKAIAKELAKHQESLRELALTSLNCAKGDARSYVIDFSRVHPVLVRLKKNRWIPGEKFPQRLRSSWDCIRKVRSVLDQHLTNAVVEEVARHNECLQGIEEHTGGLSFSDVLSKTQGFIDAAEAAAALREGKLPAKELRIMCQALGAVPLEETVAALREVRDLAAKDLPKRIDRALPLLAQDREGPMSRWEGFKAELLVVVKNTESFLDGQLKGDKVNQACERLKKDISKATAQIRDAYEALEKVGR